MSVLLITADQRRHRYLAAQLADAGLTGVVSEGKAPAVSTPAELNPDDLEVLRRHFAERDAAEQYHLGEPDDFATADVLRIPNGAVNHPAVCAWIEKLDPQVIVLYGTGILKAPLLDRFADRLVNLHLGLSPYYRGAGTNFWPLVCQQPECVGATIHRVVAKVDAGPIIAQVRPDVEPRDRAHDLGTKALKAAARVIVQVVEKLSEGQAVPGAVQDLSLGRVFRQKDFNAEAVRTVWRNLESGMIDTYLAQFRERLNHFPIRELDREPARAMAF